MTHPAHTIPWFARPVFLRPYLMALVLVTATLLARLAIGQDSIEELFVLPIIVTAYVAGCGPGLFATAVSAISVFAFVHDGGHSLSLAATLDHPDWLMLIVVGALVSFLSQAMHRARHRAEREARIAGQALAAQVRTQADLARVVATAPGILYSFRLRRDGSACVPFASEGIRAIFGIEASELEKDATPIFSMMPADDAARVRVSISASASTMSPFREEFRVRRSDGTIVWVEAHSVPAAEPDGTVLWHGFINDITDRKQADEALRATRETLQLLIEQSPVSIGMLDRDMRYVAASRQWLANFGTGLSDITGLSHYDLLPDIPARWRAIHQEGLAGNARAEDEDLWIRADGGRTWLRWAVHPWRTGTGAVGGIIIFCEDITARKLADEALLASERRYRDLVELSPDAILTTSGHRVTFANPAALELFGVSHVDALLGRPALTLIHEGDRALLENGVSRVLRGEHIPLIRHRIVREDGTTRDVESVAARLAQTGGAFQVVLRDITERRRSEAALRDSNDRFRQLAESMREVFWMSNPDATVVEYVSPAYESIWGRTRESLYASPRDWIEAIHEFDRDRVVNEVLPTQTSGYETEYRIVRPDGAIRWIRDRAFPVRDASGAVVRVTGMAEDVTERRDLESQLRQAQKLESVGLLAGGVAHDFNNWLTVITANSELLRAMLTDDDHRSLAGEISEAGARAAALTRQLLALSRQQVLEAEETDLNIVVADAEKLLRRIIGEDIVLETRSNAVNTVLVDPGHMGQVLMNLCVNARDAMPTGGSLTLTTSDVVVARAGEHPGIAPGQYVRLTVADTGVGMSPETRARIFDPFFTTKGVGLGTGLGLSVVHGIVVQSGGTIHVSSELGRGTTFTILLPAMKGSAPNATSDLIGSFAGGAESILLVEDEESVRRVAARTLAGAGYTVVEATDGVDALRQLERHCGTIDLVVTDVVMPNMGGRQFVDAMPEPIPVLYTSGYLDDAVVRNGVFHAQVAFLQKPYSAQSLMGKVREVLDRSSHEAGEFATRRRAVQHQPG